jgi:N-acetylglucosamine-6-phosphate deacetylase
MRAHISISGAVEALESASTRPARLLGIDDHKGTLKFGADADFVIVDDSINIKATFIAGRLVYAAEHN